MRFGFRSLRCSLSRSTGKSSWRRPALEVLEDRLAPAGDILATVAGPYPQHQFREYTPTGSLVRSVVVPPTPGNTFDYARGIVEDPSGKVYVYDGTFTPYLATYNPSNSSWAQNTYAGWSTVSNVSYGGLALYQNFVFASDMNTAGAAPNGIVRYDTVAGAWTRIGNGTDFTKVAIGGNNVLYGLSGQKVYEYNPVSGAALGVVTLPSGDYRGLAVSASGDIFTAAWNGVISHFSALGALIQSVTLNSSTGAPFMFSDPDDIAIAPDGTLAVGSFSGYIVQMTSSFSNIAYFNTGTNNAVFVTFAATPSQPPPPSASISNSNVVAPPSGTVPAQFVVSLSAASSQPVSVSYVTADGSAVAGKNYVAETGTLTFAPGQTIQTLSVPVDSMSEYFTPETFSVSLSNPTGATLGQSTGTGTIASSFPLPTFAVGDTSVVDTTSGTTPATFTVTLSAPSGTPATVTYYTLNGNAVAGTNYQAASGTLTFAPGQTSLPIAVNVIGNPLNDVTRAFYLELGTETGAGVTRSQAIGTIYNNVPEPGALVSNSVVTLSPTANVQGYFTISLSAPSDQTVMVNYASADGTARAGTDYNAISGTVTFAPGQTSAQVPYTVLANPQVGPSETFTLNLNSAVNATLGNHQGTATILNPNQTTPSITVGDVSVLNGIAGATTATFTVSLLSASAQTVTVNYATADGTAVAGTNYQATSGSLTFTPGQTSQSVGVTVYETPFYDINRTFLLNLTAPNNATLARSQATATIINNISAPTISVNDVSVVDPTAGTTTATFQVTLSAASNLPTTVNYATADNSAIAGTNYQAASGTLTFAPGQTSQTIGVNVFGEALHDMTRAFLLNLSAPTNATLARSQAIGSIVNNVPAPSVSVNDVSVVDPTTGTTTASFVVSLSAASALPVTVNYATADGTAVAGTNYQASSGSLTFAPGVTGLTVTVTISPNPLNDANRTFTFNLSTPGGATLGRAQGTGTIVNNVSQPSLTIYDSAIYNTTSGTEPFNFTVNLSAASDQTITVYYSTTDGTAAAGRDYQSSSGTVTFAPGQTSQTVTITLLGDPNPDNLEAFTINLSGAVNATMSKSQATGYVYPAVPYPTLSVTNSVYVNQSSTANTQAVFTVTLSAASTQTVTVNYNTADGSAVAGTDYLAASGSLTFAPGQTSQTVSVVVLPDTEFRYTVSFNLQLSSPTNATLYWATGTANLTNSNPEPSLTVSDISVQTSTTAWTSATFTVTLSAISGVGTGVYYFTSDGTARSGRDYSSYSSYLYVPAGQASGTITIPVDPSAINVPNRTFYLNLSSPMSATLARSQATGIIIEDPNGAIEMYPASNGVALDYTGTGVFTVATTDNVDVNVRRSTNPGTGDPYNEVGLFEFNLAPTTGQQTAGVALKLYENSFVTGSQPILVYGYAGDGNITTSDGSSPGVLLGSFYPQYGTGNGGTGWQTIPLDLAGVESLVGTTGFLGIQLVGMANSNTDFSSSPTSNTPALDFIPGTPAAEPALSVSNASGSDAGQGGTPPLTFTLTLSQPATTPVTVTYQTADGTAVAGTDYQATSGYAIFSPGDTQKTVTVPIYQTGVVGPNVQLTLNVSAANATLASGGGIGTIIRSTPTAAISGPSTGVRGQSLTYTFTATDLTSADQSGSFTYQIAWGDGSTQTVLGPASGVTVAHVYTAAGSDTVSVTATDQDGGTSPAATTSVAIAAVALEGGDLYVSGTTGTDTILVQPADANGTIDVVINGQDQGTFVPTGQVVVYGQAGDDTIQLGAISLPAMLFAGTGNSTLDASASTDPVVLVGGPGNNTLLAGSGRDILIGGGGSDVLQAGSGDDLLLSGTTSFDNDVVALALMRAEWSRTDADYQTRINQLTGTQTGGLNGNVVLNSQTVQDGGSADDLWAGAGQDWFVLGDQLNPDRLHNVAEGDVVTNL